MKNIGYKVAGHLFLIHVENPNAVYDCLPSYTPFLSEEKDTVPLFELTICRDLQVEGEEINRFEWDDSECVIYKKGDDYFFELFPVASDLSYVMHAEKGFSVVYVSMKGEERDAFALNNFLMMSYAFASAPFKTLMIHASVIRNAEHGYLFLGKSGTGKSTHSSLWLKYIKGSDLLNDDNPIVRIMSGRPFVYGSPWSGKTPCYRNLDVPIGAFVKLNQATENKIERVKPLQGFAIVLSSCSVMKWDERIYNGICDTISEMSMCVPIFRLDCLPDEAAARLSFNTIHK